MEEALARSAFRVGDTEYLWGDIVTAARLRGAWAELEAEVREGVACLELSSDAGPPLAAGEVSMAATAFRYERRLTSAEDMEAWLATWQVTKAEWLDHLRRSILRHRHALDLAAIAARCRVNDDEVARRAWPTAVCSSRLAELARHLAARAAVFAASTGNDPSGTSLEERLEGFELAFERFCETVPDERAIRRTLSSHHLDWIRVDSDWVCFPTEGAAREARWCVEADGMGLSEVAALAGTTVEERRFLLEEADVSQRDLLLTAAEGELLGPLPDGAGFALVQVAAKALPSAEDPELMERAKAVAVDDALQREVAERVVWHDAL